MTTSLQFALDVEDGWPPVGSESIPFEKKASGYEALSPPLFVGGLSVGDVIEISQDEFDHVLSWSYITKSERSVIWLLRLSRTNKINTTLEELRAVGCNTVAAEEIGCYSVDVPGSLDIRVVDSILDELNPDDVAIVFPSMRHSE